MFGIILGAVFSVVIFSFYSKDANAIKAHKQKLAEEQKKKEEILKAQKEKMEKIKNDPELKKRIEENEKRMRQKLFKGMNEDERKMLQSYLDQKRGTGKSDSDIMKDATNKAGLFMLVMFILMTILIFLILVLLTGGEQLEKIDLPEPQTIKYQILKALSVVYPRLAPGEQPSVQGPDVVGASDL